MKLVETRAVSDDTKPLKISRSINLGRKLCVAQDVRMKILRSDRQTRRRLTLKRPRHVNKPVEARGLSQLEQYRLIVGVHWLADTRQEQPDDGNPARTAIGRHSPIDARQQLRPPGVKLCFKLLSDGVRRVDRAGLARIAMNRRVESEAACSRARRQPLVPAEVGERGFDVDQIRTHAPADAAEMLPALTWRVTRHGEVKHLHMMSVSTASHKIPRRLKPRLEAETVVNTPSRRDRIANDSDAERARRLGLGIVAVAHTRAQFVVQRAAFVHRLKRRLEHIFTNVGNRLGQHAGIEAGSGGRAIWLSDRRECVRSNYARFEHSLARWVRRYAESRGAFWRARFGKGYRQE